MTLEQRVLEIIIGWEILEPEDISAFLDDIMKAIEKHKKLDKGDK